MRSTTKLWDATLASQAMLLAKAKGRLWDFCDPLLSAFWRREFDLESRPALDAALADAGMAVDDWHSYLQERAAQELALASARAEQLGVFGAPSFVFQGELFWGGDRLALLECRLTDAAGVQASVST